MFRLAWQMGRTVQELARVISYRELMEWMEFYKLEPWGIQTHDLHHASLMALLANQHRDPKHHPKPYVPRDFTLFSKQQLEQPKRRRKPATKKGLPHGGGARLSDETLTFFFLHSNAKKTLQ
jgi:hypothetical protein